MTVPGWKCTNCRREHPPEYGPGKCECGGQLARLESEEERERRAANPTLSPADYES